MAVTTPTQPLSLDEFLQLPEQKPAYEYINGKPHQKPMPRGKHSLLQTRLSATINGVASTPTGYLILVFQSGQQPEIKQGDFENGITCHERCLRVSADSGF